MAGAGKAADDAAPLPLAVVLRLARRIQRGKRAPWPSNGPGSGAMSLIEESTVPKSCVSGGSSFAVGSPITLWKTRARSIHRLFRTSGGVPLGLECDGSI